MAKVKIEMESYLLLLPTTLHTNLRIGFPIFFLLKERCFWNTFIRDFLEMNPKTII